MAAKIRMSDGRELTVALSGKRAAEVLDAVARSSVETFARFASQSQQRVWVNPAHVTAIEDRPELD